MKNLFDKIVSVFLVITIVFAAIDLIVYCIIGIVCVHHLINGILTLSGM